MRRSPVFAFTKLSGEVEYSRSTHMHNPGEGVGVMETKVFLFDPKRIVVKSVFAYGEVDTF